MQIFPDLAATTRRGRVVAALRSIVKNANVKRQNRKERLG
jgi:predicted RNA-binding protein YlqC (UPF0109 family)